jgi:hypothetical protein
MKTGIVFGALVIVILIVFGIHELRSFLEDRGNFENSSWSDLSLSAENSNSVPIKFPESFKIINSKALINQENRLGFLYVKFEGDNPIIKDPKSYRATREIENDAIKEMKFRGCNGYVDFRIYCPIKWWSFKNVNEYQLEVYRSENLKGYQFWLARHRSGANYMLIQGYFE